jgi:hypothetical protein
MTLPMPTISTAVPPRLRAGFAYPGSAQYQFCVDSVKRKYFDRYGAVVDPRPDVFVVARDNTRRSPTFDRTLGVAGLTAAAGRTLLSENYLDVPVEQRCAELVRAGQIDRGTIAEMGPLASFYLGTGLFLMRSLPWIARSAGYDFLVSTLTEELHDVAKVAGWDFHTLANARRSDLAPANATNWGTYYATRPRTGILRCA